MYNKELAEVDRKLAEAERLMKIADPEGYFRAGSAAAQAASRRAAKAAQLEQQRRQAAELQRQRALVRRLPSVCSGSGLLLLAEQSVLCGTVGKQGVSHAKKLYWWWPLAGADVINVLDIVCLLHATQAAKAAEEAAAAQFVPEEEDAEAPAAAASAGAAPPAATTIAQAAAESVHRMSADAGEGPSGLQLRPKPAAALGPTPAGDAAPSTTGAHHSFDQSSVSSC